MFSDLISEAQSAGIHADYVLFDSWFSSPKVIQSMKEKNLDIVALVKKISRIHYAFQGKQLPCKEIYAQCKKRCGRFHYLLSVPVEIYGGATDAESIPAKLVFVRNPSNWKDYLVLICTDIALTENEIIQPYSKRWDIEVFFKTSKSVLRLTGECRSLSYDAMCIQCAIVFARCMSLTVGHPGESGYSHYRDAFLSGSRRIGEHFICGVYGEIATFSHETARVFHASKQDICALAADFIQSLLEDIAIFLALLAIKGISILRNS